MSLVQVHLINPMCHVSGSELHTVDLARFRPGADAWLATADRPFVVGRISRDMQVQFAETDPAHYVAGANR